MRLDLFAGLGVLISAYKAKNGVWVSGLRAGKASRWAHVLMGIYAVCLVAAMYLSRVASLSWAAWVLAGLLIVATGAQRGYPRPPTGYGSARS